MNLRILLLHDAENAGGGEGAENVVEVVEEEEIAMVRVQVGVGLCAEVQPQR